VPADHPPATARKAPAFGVRFSQVTPLWEVLDQLGTWHGSDEAASTEELGQVQGLTLYRAAVDVPGMAVLAVGEVRDRAQVFLDRRPAGVLARDHHDRALALPSGAHGMLELLVEDQGRVDYGPRTGEQKGLIGPVTVNGQEVRGWQALPLPLTDITPAAAALRALPATPVTAIAGPAFARAVFDLPPGTAGTEDLFLSTDGLGKGVAWLNGFCLGRYWSRGPQRTLYVPGPVTAAHGNELIVLELGAATSEARFVPGPELGHTES
jgi:beta-galactosidase